MVDYKKSQHWNENDVSELINVKMFHLHSKLIAQCLFTLVKD